MGHSRLRHRYRRPAIHRLRASTCARITRHAHDRSRGDTRALARSRQHWRRCRCREGRQRRIRGRDRRRAMARGVVRRVHRAGKCAARGRPRSAHFTRSVIVGECRWVCVFDGTRGLQVVWRCHVWRAHDRVRRRRRCGRECRAGVGSAACRDEADVRPPCLCISPSGVFFQSLTCARSWWRGRFPIITFGCFRLRV